MTNSHHKVTNNAAFSNSAGILHIGDQSLFQLASRAGGTPFFAYNRHHISARYAYLRNHIPKKISLFYATKANPMPQLMSHLCDHVQGFDVASLKELQIALNTGMQASSISFAGPGKRDNELMAAIATGVLIFIESISEAESIARLANQMGATPRVGIRINPDFELRATGVKMTGWPTPFGIDAHLVPTHIAKIHDLGLKIEGLHVFTGSQCLEAKSLQHMHTQLFKLGVNLQEKLPYSLQTFNIGGGFGIPYFPGDSALAIEHVGEHLQTMINTYASELSATKLIMELGRYLVGESGLYVCQVIDRKISNGEVFLITDGGMHHHLAASGNLGQILRKNYPVIVANRINQAKTEVCNVVGPLCTPLDCLAKKIELPVSAKGDYIAILQSGAYGFSASPKDFLSHPHPVEILV